MRAAPTGHESSRPPIGLIRRSAIARETLRIAPGRPNVAAGLRAAIATTLPLVLASALKWPDLAITSLAGFTVVLSDKGGAYRTRAESMLALSLCGALATTLGMLLAKHSVLAVGFLAIVVCVGGFLRLFGAEATAVGVSTAVALVVALTRPAANSEALECGGLFLAGGLWAGLISLVLWPLRVYRPVRLAIASSLRELAAVAESLLDASAETAAQLARREQLGRARTAIEQARAQLGALRRGRPGPSRRGELLVALVEASDLLLGALVALEDSLALTGPRDLSELTAWIEQSAGSISDELQRVAAAIEDEQLLAAGGPELANLARAIESAAASSAAHEPRILLRALERIERLVELARAVDDPASPLRPARSEPSDLSSEASKLSLLRDHLTPDSAVFRHALRAAIATAGTLLVVHALKLEHGYWATLTCLVILQPHGTATWAKALQRVLGTILGAGLAVLVASFVRDPHLVIASVFAFVAVAISVLPLNYGAFAIFLTPGFVLLAETHAGNVDLSGVRILNTLLGAVIALLGSRLLFPLSERDQIRPLMADALAKLSALLDVVAQQTPSLERVRAARRQLGLALLNAEASYQRLLTETGIKPEQSEALLSLLLYAHRLGSGLIAIAFNVGTPAHTALLTRAEDLQRVLVDVRGAISDRRAPSQPPERSDAPKQTERVEVLFEQMAVLRNASLRLQI